MKKYIIETKNSIQKQSCDSIDFDENMYLKLIVNHQIVVMYSPDFWLSYEYVGED